MLKENFFEVRCRKCGRIADAKDFIASADFTAGTEYGTQYKYITLRCPHCRQEEVIDKTGAW